MQLARLFLIFFFCLITFTYVLALKNHQIFIIYLYFTWFNYDGHLCVMADNTFWSFSHLLKPQDGPRFLEQKRTEKYQFFSGVFSMETFPRFDLIAFDFTAFTI